MEDVLENNPEVDQLSDKDIFTKIWTSPRQVFKFINDNSYNKYVTVLLILSGISRSFDQASLKNLGDSMSLWEILAISIIGGGLLGWISFYIYASLISWTGKWLDGQGNTNSIFRMLAFSMLPSIIALVLLIPQILIYGIEIFKSEGNLIDADWLSNVFFYSSMLLQFLFGITTLIFCVIGTSEVQKLSIWKSILNLLLPVFVIIVPLIILALLFRALN